jgi:hypothetical protein
MKRKLKALLLFVMTFITFCLNAQIYDGITQPTRYRVWVPVTTSINDGDATTVAPFIGYKQDVCDWFSITPVVQYNINSETFIPQVWLNFNVKQKFYVLSRSIYDTKANVYKHTLSATYKFPLGFMIDTTWENLYNGRSLCDTDRLQFLAGYGYKWFVGNIGYSCRNNPGLIANLRFKVTDYNWLQLKYDGGIECVQISCAMQFN